MTIRDCINQLNIKIKEPEYRNRVETFISLNAPKILTNLHQKKLDELISGTFKVNGLARKYKVGHLEVIHHQISYTEGYYHNGSYRAKKPTYAIKMFTEEGVYYYDLIGNKITKNPHELDCSIAGIFQ